MAQRQRRGKPNDWRNPRSRSRSAPRRGTPQFSLPNPEVKPMDANVMFDYIVTMRRGMCTVPDLADGLGLDPESIPGFIISNGSSRMKLITSAFPEKALVVAILYEAQICAFYNNCARPDCQFFHLCRNFVTDSCSLGDSCKFSHDINDAHNTHVVKSTGLKVFRDDQILQVIRNSQPEVCMDFNTSGCRALNTGDACHKFHVCSQYVKGKCLLPNCSLGHSLDTPHNEKLKVCLPKNDKKILKMMLCVSEAVHTSSGDVLHSDAGRWRDMPRGHTPRGFAPRRGAPRGGAPRGGVPRGSAPRGAIQMPQKSWDGAVGGRDTDAGELRISSSSRGLGANLPRKPICHHNIERTCRYDQRSCKFDHSYDLPYMWCINLNDDWFPLHDLNVQIEREFSRPESVSVRVNSKVVDEILNHSVGEIKIQLDDMSFPRMTCPVTYDVKGKEESTEVVRLSTKSYVQDISFEKKGKDGFVTVWRWYWLDNDGWKPYGEDDDPPHQDAIESEFLANTEELHFTVGRFDYTLHLQKGHQVNKKTGTKRDVQRRPVFVSDSAVKGHKYPSMPKRTCDPKAIKSGKKDVVPSTVSLPDGWRAMSADSPGYELIDLLKDSAEYLEVKRHFSQTMPSSKKVVSIQRVQNLLLYKDLANCRATLKLKYKGSVPEELDLFHGTRSEETVKSICYQGFDPRIHAVTAYGKGAYFARDASYSDKYTGHASTQCMFRSRVIVGKYTEGREAMQRPPVLPGFDYELYDSTVNTTDVPTIFVVYDRAQCYPSHLIKYRRA